MWERPLIFTTEQSGILSQKKLYWLKISKRKVNAHKALNLMVTSYIVFPGKKIKIKILNLNLKK